MYGMRQSLNHNVRCELCHRQTKLPYLMNIEGQSYYVCSAAHAQIAMKNFKDKREEGFTPSAPPQTPEEEVHADD